MSSAIHEIPSRVPQEEMPPLIRTGFNKAADSRGTSTGQAFFDGLQDAVGAGYCPDPEEVDAAYKRTQRGAA